MKIVLTIVISILFALMLAVAMYGCGGCVGYSDCLRYNYGSVPDNETRTKRLEYEKVRKALTPQAKNFFISLGCECFKKKVVKWVDKDGDNRTTSCYNSSSSWSTWRQRWVTECEPMCISEVPECYVDGWNPPMSKRRKNVKEWHEKNDKR